MSERKKKHDLASLLISDAALICGWDIGVVSDPNDETKVSAMIIADPKKLDFEALAEILDVDIDVFSHENIKNLQ